MVYLFDVRTELSLAASALLFRAVTGGGGCCWAGDGFPKVGVAPSSGPRRFVSIYMSPSHSEAQGARWLLGPLVLGPPRFSGVEERIEVVSRKSLRTHITYTFPLA